MYTLGLIYFLLPSTFAIYCFECDSSNNFPCSEYWDATTEVAAEYFTNCDHVYEASYCVKMTGVYDGKLGTKRFCSSRDWGDYCEYIKRPGDIQEYRSCVYSCTEDACNSSTKISSANTLVAILSFIVAITLFQ